MLPYGYRHIAEDDIAAMNGLLRSDYLAAGPAVARFERALATRVGAARAVRDAAATRAILRQEGYLLNAVAEKSP